MSYLRRGGGYCFNVGCSDLIINGEVGLVQYSDIDTFISNGVRLKDGSTIEADLLVTATGYKNQQDTVRHYLGDDVAELADQDMETYRKISEDFLSNTSKDSIFHVYSNGIFIPPSQKSLFSTS